MNPPRNGEGDRPKGGGGALPQTQRPAVYRARTLRKAMTLPENMLWQQLRQRPNGLKFRRQHPIGPYVVDFCCMSHRFAVEVDGFAHDIEGRAAQDQIRTKYINDNGYRVLRVAAARVIANAVGVTAEVVAFGALPLHHPAGGPPPRAGED